MSNKRDLASIAGLGQLKSLTEMEHQAQTGKVLLLNPADIITQPQVRKKFSDIEALAESMKVEQQSPIIVSPVDKNTGKYLLQKGERRLRAALLIPGFKIRAIVDSVQRSQAEWIASQLVENIQRNNLTPNEIGRALLAQREVLQKEGKKGTGRELAKMLSVPESWVSMHLQLADLPDDLVELIDGGIISDTEVIHALKKIHELTPDRYAALILEAKGPEAAGLGRETARHWLKVAQGKITPDTAPPTKPIDTGLQTPAPQVPAGGASETNQTAMVGSGSTASSSSHEGRAEEGESPQEKNPHAETNTAPVSQQLDQQLAQELPPAANPGEDHGKHNGVVLTQTPPGKKLGKNQVADINPNSIVLYVRIALDKTHTTGELLINKYCGDPTKGAVTYLDGGKQVEKLVPLDCIEILKISPIAAGD